MSYPFPSSYRQRGFNNQTTNSLSFPCFMEIDSANNSSDESFSDLRALDQLPSSSLISHSPDNREGLLQSSEGDQAQVNGKVNAIPARSFSGHSSTRSSDKALALPIKPSHKRSQSSPVVPSSTLKSANTSPSKIDKRSFKRIDQACENCRIRKHRCSGGNVCERCSSKKLECLYDEVTPNDRRRASREMKRKGSTNPDSISIHSQNPSQFDPDQSAVSRSRRFISAPSQHSSGLGSKSTVDVPSRRRRVTISNNGYSSVSNGRASSPTSTFKRARLSTADLDSEPLAWSLRPSKQDSSSPLSQEDSGAEQIYSSRPPTSSSIIWEEKWESRRSQTESCAVSSGGSSISLPDSPFYPQLEERDSTAENSLLFSPLDFKEVDTGPADSEMELGLHQRYQLSSYYQEGEFGHHLSSQGHQPYPNHQPQYEYREANSLCASNYSTPTQLSDLGLPNDSPMITNSSLPPPLLRRNFLSLTSIRSPPHYMNSPQLKVSASLPSSPSSNAMDLNNVCEEFLDFDRYANNESDST